MRKNKTMRLRIQPYSLLEMLAVIALIAILFNGALYLFYNGNHLSRTAADRAQTLKTASALGQAWRMLVKESGAPKICRTERIEFADGNYAALENGSLIFAGKHQKKRSFALPTGATASFAREDVPGEAPLLILSLRPLGSKGQKIEDKYIRLVAVAAEAEEVKDAKK